MRIRFLQFVAVREDIVVIGVAEVKFDLKERIGRTPRMGQRPRQSKVLETLASSLKEKKKIRAKKDLSEAVGVAIDLQGKFVHHRQSDATEEGCVLIAVLVRRGVKLQNIRKLAEERT